MFDGTIYNTTEWCDIIGGETLFSMKRIHLDMMQRKTNKQDTSTSFSLIKQNIRW